MTIPYRQALDMTLTKRPFCKVCSASGDIPRRLQEPDFSTIQHGLVWDGEKMAPCFVGQSVKTEVTFSETTSGDCTGYGCPCGLAATTKKGTDPDAR